MRCRFTILGKFTNSMPKMEIIRKQFIVQTKLRGGVKLSYFNSRHLYIHLVNEGDQAIFWSKEEFIFKGN